MVLTQYAIVGWYPIQAAKEGYLLILYDKNTTFYPSGGRIRNLLYFLIRLGSMFLLLSSPSQKDGA